MSCDNTSSFAAPASELASLAELKRILPGRIYIRANSAACYIPAMIAPQPAARPPLPVCKLFRLAAALRGYSRMFSRHRVDETGVLI